MKKRLIALLLVFSLCLGLAAEAAADEASDALAGAAAAETSEASPGAAAQEAAESAEALPQQEEAAVSPLAEEASEEQPAVQYFAEGTVYLPVETSVSLLAEGAELPEGAVLVSDSEAVTISETGEAIGTAAGSANVTLAGDTGEVLDTVKVICYQTGGYFTQEACYVKVGGTLKLETALALPEGAEWSAETPANVTVSSSGKLTGKAIGRSAISLKLPDGTVLDTIQSYAFEPTTWSVTPKKAKSGVLHARTLKTVNKYKSRTYYLYKQQWDSKTHRYLSANGCSVTAVADILTGYGFTDVDPLWLQTTCIPQVAEKLGVEVGNHLSDDETYRSERKTLGFYGMQQTLLSMGVVSEIRSACGDIEGAAEDITAALSEGRPVILLINKADEEGYPRLCSTWHYLFLSGIDEDGYVLNTCGSSANVQTTNALNGKAAKVTVTDLLTHYRKSSYQERKTDDDFFISTKETGSLTYLVCLSSEPGLAENVISAGGKTLTVSAGAQSFSLNASAKGGAALHYTSDSTKITVDSSGKVTIPKKYVGSATITITSDETELYSAATKKVTVQVNRAKNTISAGNKTLTVSSKERSFSLNASVKGGAKLHYQSDSEKISVDSSGKVTVPKNYVGSATITITSDQTGFYQAASKKVTVRVNRAKNTISGENQTVTTKNKPQTLSLGCSAKGNAALSYRSSGDSVTVSDEGVVTVPEKFVGKAVITVTSAKTSRYKKTSKKFTVTVLPRGTKLTSCANKSGKKLQVKWKKNSAVSGYQIQYSASSSFKSAKKVTVKGSSTTSKAISSLKKKKTYYVRVRTYKTVDGEKLYSSWSSAKKVKIKK